jgi:hypothetical protein
VPSPDFVPEIDLALLRFLERLYPPVCYDPRRGTLEDHLMYAGKAELVAELRETYNRAEEYEAEVTTAEINADYMAEREQVEMSLRGGDADTEIDF